MWLAVVQVVVSWLRVTNALLLGTLIRRANRAYSALYLSDQVPGSSGRGWRYGGVES